ncbi:hypothetical protein [Mycobacterium intracellulare]|uniref:hypothetical protein n=1 Tax=Mycobacterium intracellulare TaxID=1767 RepID=UPI00109EDE36|nr:hypothetical protein [Mycobacterium intracellulare]
MSGDNNEFLGLAREALEQELATVLLPAKRSWHESSRKNEATVLALDVSVKPDGTRLEELAGIAIFDGYSLFLAFRRGDDWQMCRPSGPLADFAQEARNRWREHPEVNGLGDAEGFVTYYVNNPDDEQFHDAMTLSVSTCGNSIFVPEEDSVLLSLDGSTRLLNVFIEPDEARRLATLLKDAASKVEDGAVAQSG